MHDLALNFIKSEKNTFTWTKFLGFAFQYFMFTFYVIFSFAINEKHP